MSRFKWSGSERGSSSAQRGRMKVAANRASQLVLRCEAGCALLILVGIMAFSVISVD